MEQIYIAGKKDLACAYIVVHFVQESLKEEGVNVEAARDVILKYKKGIREYHKRQAERQSSRLVKDYGVDGYVELVQFPENVQDEREAIEYFDDEVRMYYYPSQYDCTGQAFTGWKKIFKRDGKYMCYHRVLFDV